MSNAPRQSVIQTAINRKHPRPCYGCTQREVKCHSQCKEWADWKQKVQAESREVFASMRSERILDNAEIRAKKQSLHNGRRGRQQKWSMYKGEIK